MESKFTKCLRCNKDTKQASATGPYCLKCEAELTEENTDRWADEGGSDPAIDAMYDGN